MATWRINPHDGVVPPYENSDGNFTLSPSAPVGKKYTITYDNGSGNVQTIDYTRETECTTCLCSDLIFTQDGEIYYNVAEHSNVYLGKLSFKEGSNCDLNKVGVTGDTGFTNIYIDNSYNVYCSFSAFTQKFLETGRKLEFQFTLNSTTVCSNRYAIYQQAWRGTDNGTDTFINNFKLQYPILLCYCKGRCDYDTIIAQNGAWYYDESTQSCTKIDPNWGGVIIDGWCRFFCRENYPGYCNQYMIACKSLSANKTGEIRKAYITLSSIPSKYDLDQATVICQNAGDVHHSGETCALTWRYEVWQLPEKTSMLYQDDGLNFKLLTNDELRECYRLGNENCGWKKSEDCRSHETDECDCDN